MREKRSLSFNLLRLIFIVILSGLFLPIGCSSTGHEIAQGILGNTFSVAEGNSDFFEDIAQGVLGKGQLRSNAMWFAPLDDVYAFILYGVFFAALLGLIITFVSNSFFVSWIFAVISFVFLMILFMKLNINFDVSSFKFFVRFAGIRAREVKFDYGGYMMLGAYVTAAVLFVLRILRVVR